MISTTQKKGYLAITLAGCLWGTIGFFVVILQGFGAETSSIAFLRISTATLLMIPLILLNGGKALFRIDIKGLLICAALGIMCQAMFNYMYNVSIENVGVSTASILLYTSPVFVCILSRVFFKEKINGTKLIALAINVLGCVLTVTGGNFSTLSFSAWGVFAGTLAGFLYGLMTIISKTTANKYHPLTIIFYSFVFGSIALAVITRPFVNIAAVFSLKFLLVAFCYGLIPTVGSYYFYMKGLNCNLETSKVPVIASVETVVAAIIGFAVFSESAGIIKIVGIMCVILSIGILNYEKKVK